MIKNDVDYNKIIKRVGLIVFIVGILCILLFSIITYKNLLPVNSDSNEDVIFAVESGWGKNKIADELEKDGLIKSAFFFKIYTRLNYGITYYAGTYKLSSSMNSFEIMEILSNGNSLENESIKVTFVEGKRFPYYISKIAENFDYSEEEIYELLSDESYLNSLINKYWFITEEILDTNLYYPLEGYLFADTYEFKKIATIEEIIDKMLSEMGNKLEVYKDIINVNKYSVHDLLTMASMVELEAVTAKDRLIVAGVFYNRLEQNIALGSDVTTYYAEQKEMSEKLYNKEINRCNAYNTRGTCAVTGLPVGPICSPSYSSITAALEPEATPYLFFVADKNNDLYFSNTNEENIKKRDELIQKNLWPE